jgi:hypothetical protein
VAVTFMGCEPGPAERAGEKIDRALDRLSRSSRNENDASLRGGGHNLDRVGAGAGMGGRAPATPVPPMPIVNCPLHGIAYDEEREVCPECTKSLPGII